MLYLFQIRKLFFSKSCLCSLYLLLWKKEPGKVDLRNKLEGINMGNVIEASVEREAYRGESAAKDIVLQLIPNNIFSIQKCTIAW